MEVMITIIAIFAALITIWGQFKDKLKWFFYTKGYSCREDYFEYANKNLDKNHGLIEDVNQFFGYTEYPPYFGYEIPAGVRQHTRKKPTREQTNIQKGAIDFFENVIVDFECEYNSKTLNKKNNDVGKFSIEHIYKNFILPLTKCTTPNTVLLTGKIGDGKSTLASSIMYEFWKDQDHTGLLNCLPLKIDLRATLEHLLDIGKQVEFITDNEFCNEIDSVLCKQIKHLLNEQGIIVHGETPSFPEIVNECEKRNQCPIFIFDELDTIYYYFCVATSNPQINQVSRSKLFNRYVKVMDYLYGVADNKLRVCNPSVPTPRSPIVIIAARKSTAVLNDETRKKTNWGKSTNNLPDTHLKITKLSDARLKDIIKGWVKYYKNKSERNGQEDLKNNLENIELFLEKIELSKKLNKNLNLSVHGLRHIMKILAKLLSHDDKGELLKSCFEKHELLTMYQFLDGCEKYSQTVEGVSNIFLINNKFRSEEEKTNDNLPKALFTDHMQTYWLKYFLIKYIVQFPRKYGNRKLAVKNILEDFAVDEENLNYLKFEKEILHLVLLHATEVIHGRLLKIGSSEDLGVETDVIASKRAIELSDGIFWEFIYFLIVVEDNWLMFPKGVEENFRIDEESKRAHYFVTNFHKFSSDEKLNFIKYKSEMALNFLCILEISYEIEKTKYKDAFNNVRKVFNNNINIDTYLEVNKDRLIKSILGFTESLTAENKVEEVSNHIKDYLGSKDYKKFKRTVYVAYIKYERKRDSIFPTTSHMKNYHKKYKELLKST